MTARRFFPSTIRVLDTSLPFISTWRTTNTSTGSSASNQVKLPLLNGGIYDFTVDWGDGSTDNITAWNQIEATHTFPSSGEYTISITGTFIGFQFNIGGDILKILDISQFGSLKASSGSNFYGCANLDISATDLLDISLSNRLTNLFRNCSSLIFNSSINSWDVSGIIDFVYTFSGASSFNQPLNNWVTTSLRDLFGTFSGASSFNQSVNSWDVSGVTRFNNCFQGTIYNQPLNSWVTSSATSMFFMFNESSFNQPIGSWDVSSVSNFQGMFYNASFNQPIGSWDVSGATNMNSMFRGSAFNQDISTWVVSSVSSFALMFQNASSFNQNIGGWNMSSATSLQAMFQNATAFDQNIGGWNVSGVTVFTIFMTGKSNANFSASNLDAIYNGWSTLTLSPNEAIDFGTIKYTAAATAARALLTRTNATVTVTNAANNGSGLIRITTGAAHGRTTGDKIFISGVTGTTEANGAWIVTVIDATTVDLQASTFTNTYVSGGTFRIGYGWTITDGGL